MRLNTRLLYLLAGFAFLVKAFAGFSPEEIKTQKYFNYIKNDPSQLYAILKAMPKGGDLHSHLSGSSYAENLLKYAKDDVFCINKKNFQVSINPSCETDNILSHAVSHANFYNHLIDAWSMRHFITGKESGHDHFFATFSKFGALSWHYQSRMLAEVAERAAKQNESYLELMITPDGNDSGKLGKKLGWNSDFSKMRNKLLSSGLRKIIEEIFHTLEKEKAAQQVYLACATSHAHPGCKVKIRYLYQVLRENPPEMVFAQLLAGFEAANKEKQISGINMVQAEDGPVSMHDYKLHMQMIEYLHQIYPKVRISLHAGELTDALVPKAGLKSHIHDAVTIGHANRIGHGVDILQEENPDTLLSTMADQHVLVEINLSSNKFILGISGKSHPLLAYISHGVPVTLSTDDEGINRSNLTKEYIRAVQTYNLDYLTLKRFARNSLMYAFLQGKSLWMDDTYEAVNPACKNDSLGKKLPSMQCKLFLNANEKAYMQWNLEKRFKHFELIYNQK